MDHLEVSFESGHRTGQLNPLFHTSTNLVNGVELRQNISWLLPNSYTSPRLHRAVNMATEQTVTWSIPGFPPLLKNACRECDHQETANRDYTNLVNLAKC